MPNPPDLHLWLILFFPLLGALINGTIGRRLSKPVISAVAIGSVALSLLWVLKSLSDLGQLETAHIERYFTWIASGDLKVGFDLSIDRLSSIMLLVVTGVGLLIHIYAVGYMDHEEGFWRFFSYLNLFMFFMLILVLAQNFLLLFVGWEGVGLCSYLLIGFYFLEKFAGDAAKKAFIVNRIGDFGFSLAMLLLVVKFGSLDMTTVFDAVKKMPIEQSAGTLTTVALLLLVGAAGKSAQFPLYVWLPDAMAGPTPVSALIHAATMVTAGVYVVARSSEVYLRAPIAMETVAIVGLITAVLAALIGMAQNDIKKVFAYSTVSQLGYMFLALGVGAFSAGIFHVVTHAFFKALLFLGAGSVIHALHGEQDLNKMGGLRSKIPITYWTLLIAAIAISGVWPFAGFHSKDAILLAAYAHAPWMYWVGVVTAGLTAFYVFRAIFLCFFGEYRGKAHPHESPAIMYMPLVILALLSVAGGYLPVMEWLEPLFPEHAELHAVWLIATSLGFAFFGIFVAYYVYVLNPGSADGYAKSFGSVYRTIANKFYVDEIYDAAIVHPLEQGSRHVLDEGVEQVVISGGVGSVVSMSRWFGGAFRLLQAGNIRSYAVYVLLGAVLFLGIMVANGGVR
ncbi:NADH-quinone oxidoreductase subunit L [Bryobacter aggregatus]|uniref:NADH-quinone oxidoreductase subunit L n=1 Tax=Bryobacter aggregatus TaxID=360054 RepID=UPI0004E1461A|nr:NADH-quinone oxidoreductase subunit L [Bryobacter aggregatus]